MTLSPLMHLEQGRSLRAHLPQVQAARLAAPAGDVDEHEDTSVVELAILLGFEVNVLPCAQPVSPKASAIPAIPLQVSGLGSIGES